MPDSARVYLDGYTCTLQDKKRRLALSRDFKPGVVSARLANVVFWVEDGDEEEDDEENEAIGIKRRRGEYPWLLGIARWGYPPGWIAGKGESSDKCRCEVKNR